MDKMLHLYLDRAARQRIKQAVESAEKLTVAEIVPVVALRCSHPSSVALLAGLLLLVGMWGLGASLGALLLPWGHWAAHLVDVLAAGLAGWGLAHWGWLRKALVPRHERVHAVHLAAEAAFHRYGLHQAQGDSGVLIFASLQEQQVVVLAGAGIAVKVEAKAWDSVRDQLLGHAAQGDLASGFVAAIEEASRVLQAHYPGQKPKGGPQLDDRLRVMHVI